MIEVVLPDGRIIEFPDGTPPETMKAVAAKAAGTAKQTGGARTGAEEMRARGLSSPDQSAANAKAEQAIAETWVRENPVFSRAASFTAGIPLVGEWFDEALGAVKPEAGVALSRARNTMSAARPIEDAAWRLGGAVAGTVAGARVLGPLAVAGAPATLPAQVGYGALVGGAGGAAEGAVSGAGRAGTGSRASGAASGAAMGGAFGAGVGAAAPLAAAGLRQAVHYLRGSDISTISDALGISPQAARAVKVALEGDDLATAARNIDRGGPNAMLVEGGPSTQALGSATAASGGRATAIMREGIDARMAQGASDVRSAMDDAFRPGTAVIPKPPKIGTAYDAAYAKPIDYSSSEGRQIEALISRVPKEEWAKARKLAEMDPDVPEGIKRQFLISVQPDGTIKRGTLPSVLELDYVTRSLNDTAKAGDGKGALGGNTNQGRLYGKLAQRIREPLKRAVPEYGQALDYAATEIGLKEAREFGEIALRPSTSRADVVEQLKGAPHAERLAARAAVRQAIDDTLANTRRTMSRGGTDVGEAIRAVKDLSSRAARDKLAVILGPQEAENLVRSLDEAATAFEIGAALSRNSDTAVREAVQGSVRASASPNVVQRLMAGSPIRAAKRLTQIFTGSSPEAQAAREAGIFEEIATALTQTKGPNARRALVLTERAMSGQKLTEKQARDVAGLITSALGGGAYQLGMQSTGTR